ncbi:MAG: type II secretion system protein M [Ectothiorhodospiraceae bacterium]|nr:type II secretion system protein M [Ectothiorhodospiraceae bacterium]
MKDWIMGLETNERRMLLGGGGLLLVMFLYLGIWEPLVTGVDELRVSTVQQETLLVWMRGAAQEVKQLRGSGGQKTKQTGGGSLLSLVDRTAKAARLGPALKRVQPDGEDKVRVWLESASFDDLVRWLSTLDTRHDVQAVSSVFQAVEATGRVDARLVFETGR